jgi:dihydrofolate synthase / folylpolyglutamate synthase
LNLYLHYHPAPGKIFDMNCSGNELALEIAEEASYQKALDYVYSFVDFSMTVGLAFSPDKFDLGRMFRLMEELGNPHLKYPVIHVAGTKGKGSTSAMMANVLKAAGYRTALYTSPHLIDYVERIQLDGQNISHRDFVSLVEEIKPYVARIPQLTTFEITTALGFMYFAQQKADIAVIEVGLGGRLDATNVVSPLVSVITSLSYDHMKILGNTLAQIAFEKAGIIKPGRPVVLAPQQEEARIVVKKVAAERASTLYQVGKDTLFAPRARSLDGQSLFVWTAEDQPLVDEFVESGGMQDWEPPRLNIPLLGYHQVENAATAYTALQVARQQGIKISDEAIKNGFAGVTWPARFEVLQRSPLLIIDSAHNRDSGLKLRLAIEDYLPSQPVILVFGASEDKDVDGMFADLLPRVRQVIATQSNHPRALEAARIVELAHKHGVPAEAVLPSENALIRALNLAGQECAVVVAGSLFIAAETREKWFKMKAVVPYYER